jgi:NADH-quinone oxidoreductase subunit F
MSAPSPYKIIVGLGSCGIAAGAKNVYRKIEELLVSTPGAAELHTTSCIGMCFCEPIVEVIAPNGARVIYGELDEKKAAIVVEKHILGGEPVGEYSLDLTSPGSGAYAFSKPQKKIVLRNCGVIDPESIEAYMAKGGYKALGTALKMESKAVIDSVKASGLRGRGGAGFTTGLKWQLAAESQAAEKYIICNADEGDPGAFMDRSVLEGDPHSVIEGMLIAGYAMGATKGYIYCRAEYPLAIHRLKIALSQARDKRFLGENILGSKYSFSISIKEGAGAFVCGEETAMIASIEGRRGMPKRRPPFPTQAGLFGHPTSINNVESFANVPWIIENGAEKFSSIGTEKSKGTKVFALAGKISRGGLVEVPMGTTIKEIVEDIGGGSSTGKPLKAIQMGGPSGGCIPASLFHKRIDYDELTATGAIMGSGGMLVMDETTCMVDVAKFFLKFTQEESCGKCTFCRIGTKRMLEILERITSGHGTADDVTIIENLAGMISKGSLCGLGQTAPNPVLTTLKYFREEYIEHIAQKKCRAGVCKPLIRFNITEDCTGCGACVRVCPIKAITGSKKTVHVIDAQACIKCGRCKLKCAFEAIEIQ